MRLDVTAQELAEHSDGRSIDPDGAVPDAVYRYISDHPEDGIGPNGVTIALYREAGRAAIAMGGDWVWDDYTPEWKGQASPLDADYLLDRYLAGEWGDE